MKSLLSTQIPLLPLASSPFFVGIVDNKKRQPIFCRNFIFACFWVQRIVLFSLKKPERSIIVISDLQFSNSMPDNILGFELLPKMFSTVQIVRFQKFLYDINK